MTKEKLQDEVSEANKALDQLLISTDTDFVPSSAWKVAWGDDD